MEGKYSIQWFEGESDVSSTSIESVCTYDEEEENNDNEYESDSETIFCQWWRWKIMFQLSSKTQTTLKVFVSHSVLYESYKVSMTMYEITLYIFMF